jgi:aryl-alcohol dehydrogenase-like predicted oxidoreductase
MDRRALGSGGLTVSPLAWGMWRFKGDDLAAAQARVEAALAAGIDLFDTADIYGPDNGEPFGAAESLLGRVFAGSPGLRDGLVLATKGGIEMGVPYNSSADYLERACEASLRRLRVERIDLYQIHRPDILAHPAEVAAALERLRAAGKIAEVGVSNHTPAQVRALIAHLPFPLAAIQPEFSPLEIAPIFDGILDQAMELGLCVLAWSPLAGGLLASPGAYRRAVEVSGVLRTLADVHGVDPSAIACAWIMTHPARPIPIVGSQRPERIAEAAQASRVTLSRAEWYAVLVAARGEPLP